MAFAPLEKIMSFFHIPVTYAADGEAEAGVSAEQEAIGEAAAPSEAGAEAEIEAAEPSGDAPPGAEIETAEPSGDAPPEPAESNAAVPPEADAKSAPNIATPLETGAAETPGLAAGTDEGAPAFADEKQQKLHDKALRFANGRTGLLGLVRRLRGVIPLVAALATKAFARSKISFSRRTPQKFEVSKDLEQAFSSEDESVPAAETERADKGPAPAADAKRKARPAAKNATVKKGTTKSPAAADVAAPEAPQDKAAAKKAKEKERAAARKAKENEKKEAQKAKAEAKKAAKAAKEEAKKAAKEAKEAAFAEKYPKKAAKRAEQAAKKAEKKAAAEEKKKAKPDPKALKAAKAAAKAAKKAKREENKKPKLTKEEKFQLKLDKQAARHEKRIERFERKAQKIEQRLEKKHKKKESIKEKKNEEKSIRKEQKRIRRERKREIKKQKKYWLSRGVGRAKRNASVISLVVLIIAALATGTTFLYKSERVHIPLLNKAVQTVADSPVMSAVKFLDKPTRVALRYAAVPVSYVMQLIRGKPKAEDLYYFEAGKTERYETYSEAHPDMPIDEVVWRVNAGVDLPLYQEPVTVTDFGKQPILINKFHKLSEDYEPQGMVQMQSNVLMQADSKAAEAFLRLREAAARENLHIAAASAYRSYEYQNLIYNPRVSDTRERQENFLSRPGFCENQTGFAFDLSADGGRMYDFAGTPEAAWIAENAEKFGFILRFPAGFEDVTGAPYQPWHIRYVGDAVIKTMQENNIKTLEEYCVKFVDHKPGDKPEKPIKHGGMTEEADGPI